VLFLCHKTGGLYQSREMLGMQKKVQQVIVTKLSGNEKRNSDFAQKKEEDDIH
jgi:hypothetical protein